MLREWIGSMERTFSRSELEKITPPKPLNGRPESYGVLFHLEIRETSRVSDPDGNFEETKEQIYK